MRTKGFLDMLVESVSKHCAETQQQHCQLLPYVHTSVTAKTESTLLLNTSGKYSFSTSNTKDSLYVDKTESFFFFRWN